MSDDNPLSKYDPLAIGKSNTMQSRQGMALFDIGGFYQRDPLLPPYGTKARERAQLALSRNNFNTLWTGAISGVIKKIQSTDWEIIAPDEYGDYFNRMLQTADLGGGWGVFISKLLLDYSRYDSGAFVELIGAGDPSSPLVTPVVAIANLDTTRCWLSGDDEYPVWYQSQDGMYKIHRTRVLQFVDTPESEEYRRGYGYSALSRAVALIYEDIYMQRYIVQKMDNKPAPGVVIAQNVKESDLNSRFETMTMQREADDGGAWGNVLWLYAMMPEYPMKLDFVTFTQPPDGWSYTDYYNLLAKKMANALNLDITEFWELAQTGGLGTAGQARIIEEKARGKTIGNLYKLIERLINEILPYNCEFRFRLENVTEDTQRATLASQWASVLMSLSADLSTDERRKILASVIPEIADVITNEQGQVTSLADGGGIDETTVTPDTYVSPANMDDAQINDDVKSFVDTIAGFVARFGQNVRAVINGTISRSLVRGSMRATLSQGGTKAFIDGKQIGGGEGNLTLADEEYLARWRYEEFQYLTGFLDSAEKGGISQDQLDNHLQMWINKSLRKAYYKGLESAGRNKWYMWVYGLTEHCDTCLMAHGQVHRMKAWVNAGILPQSDNLQCGGYHCQCVLTPVMTPRLFGKGNLQALKRTLRKSHRHTAGGLTLYHASLNPVDAIAKLERMI